MWELRGDPMDDRAEAMPAGATQHLSEVSRTDLEVAARPGQERTIMLMVEA